MIRHASLFSGIGGADLAAYQVGWTNMFTCEIDDFCNKVLDYWFPNTERYHDIKGTDFSKWRGKIDVLSGGPPCQAVSVAGKRKGDKDDRFLWDEFIRAVREIQPAWIVAENVYGILSMVESGETPYVEREDSLFGEIEEDSGWVYQRYVLYKIISEIENEGYEALPIVIPACAVGAPHKRMRVWIICHRVDADTEGEPRGEHNGETSDGESRGFGGVHSEEYVTDSGSVGRETGGDNLGQGQLRDSSRRNDKEDKRERDGRVDRIGQAGKITADTDGAGLQEERSGEQPAGSSGESEGRAFTDTVVARVENVRERENGICEQGHPSNPDGELVERRDGETQEERKRAYERIESFGSQRGWGSFPSVSPVCGRDDGLSGRLDGITFSKWRKESIKAYGNAWCVPVAYEIFRILDKYMKTNK